jgi:hypothetical protein
VTRYDSILVATTVGGNRKLRRMRPEHRWTVIAGVWALAGESPIRGYLLITEQEHVSDQDIAERAGVTLKVVRATLTQMRALAMLEWDENIRAEHVHDWHEHQPDPRPSDTREAWRDRKRRQRDKSRAGHDDVTRDGHDDVPPPKKKVRTTEEANASSTSTIEAFRDDVERLCVLLATRIEENGSRRPTITDAWRRQARLLLDRDGREEADVARVIEWCQADPFWRANVMSMPTLRKQYDRLWLQAQRGNGHGPTPERRERDRQGHAALKRLLGQEAA